MHKTLSSQSSDTMKIPTTRGLATNSAAPFLSRISTSTSALKWVPQYQPCWVEFRVSLSNGSARCTNSSVHASSPAIQSDFDSNILHISKAKLQLVEETVEKVIYSCRFFAILAVWGSLIGSFLCFIKGCTYVISSFQEYFSTRAKVILFLVEAIDIYLLGTVMLVFGMGLYELFISNLDKSKSMSEERTPYRSNLFGIFTLKERPKWLEIKTVSGLKTKVGHVIVMLLLIGLFEKSKKAVIHTPLDLLCFSASVLLCSGCLFLLSRLTDEN
ncbi:PREDICTED: uncharacterized protein LOC109240199 [Nicotiana attenuata]|uniref:Uncharacterized protein n=1 Tax=Nicotiana attenuata TaxID=49451 RepID=A0A314L9W9_NICAT|nr:PREDICTED: uncharacterized protein LOC109240199 [Nicotiana attenuata]OIT37849.1 hypothetical protein A4A49_08617 [Nicotiana attenuata]